MPKKSTDRTVFIVSPTESIMTRRGMRHPRLAQFLVNAGYQVEYVTTDFSHASKRSFSLPELKEAQQRVPYKLTILRMPGYQRNISVSRIFFNFLFAARSLLLLYRKTSPLDIILVPSRPPELVFGAALLGSIRNSISVMDIRDIWPDALESSNTVVKKLFSLYCNLFLKPSVSRMDHCFHSAPSFLNWLHRYAPKAQSHFLPLGFDSDRWSEAVPKDKLCYTDGRISLVFVGVLQHQLNLMPVIEALTIRKHYTLTIIGDNGTGERFPEVSAFIKLHSLDNVIMLGQVSPDEVVEHLKHHDIGIVPMIASSVFPNKLFDFLAAYLPILSLGENDTSLFVEKNNIGWVAPFDAEAVGKVLDNITPNDVIDRVRNIAKIRDNFSRDHLFREALSVFEEPQKVANLAT